MGKRSNYARRERDYYATPAKGAAPLLPFLIRDGIRDFAEICAGNDHLVRHLEFAGLRCVYKGDIATGQDALKLTLADLNNAQAVITNPPTKYAEERGSTTRLLTDLLQHVLDLGVPAWWLIHHDWVTSLRAVPFLKHCSDIVPCPRLKWIEGTKDGAMDSFSWFRIDPQYQRAFTPIHHRGVAPAPPGPICAQCRRPYRSQRATSRFCSDACRQRAHRARDGLGGVSVT